MHYYLGLGSNLGEREQTIESALRFLEQEVGPIVRRSDYYYSAPWGFESEHGFCNICVCVETDLQPLEVLARTQQIEQALGRTTKSSRDADGRPIYHDRPIDIDLLRAFAPLPNSLNPSIPESLNPSFPKSLNPSIPNSLNPSIPNSLELSLSSPSLTLPHPLWQERDFVRIPLSQILE